MIKAIVFDVYGTLFDVHSITTKADELFHGSGAAISGVWREKQVEYSFLRQLMGRYVPFHELTEDALRYALHAQHVSFSEEDVNTLMDEYKRLSLYAEVADVLAALSEQRLVVFSNGSKEMLEPLIAHAGIGERLEKMISVDTVKQYKPTPASYLAVLQALDVSREDVLFLSSNGWDISGAKSFGFQTAWINRKGLPVEELQLAPDYVWSSLHPLVSTVQTR